MLASKDWELAAILSKGQVYPSCFPAILLGRGRREGNKKREVLHVIFFIVLQRNPLVILPKQRIRVNFYLTLPEGNTSFLFHFTFVKEYIYLFIYLNVGHAKKWKDVSLDSLMENSSKKTIPCWEQKEEECINFKLTWFLAYDSPVLTVVHMNCLLHQNKHLLAYLSF